MNWEAIAAIAQILGTLAVIVTLVLLVLQLRSNSAMIQNQTEQNSAHLISAWMRQLTENTDLFQLYRSGLRKDATLSNDDRARFDLIVYQASRSVYSIYAQYLNNGMSKARWEAELRSFRPVYDTPGGKAAWERQRDLLDPDFVKAVEQHFAG